MGVLTATRFARPFIALLTLCGSGALAALEKEIDLSLVDHQSWSGTRRAPNGVTTFSQAPDGRFYLGAEGGVFDFDGLRHKMVSSPERRIFSSSRVTTSCMDHEGALWVGYESGFVDRAQQRHSEHHPPGEQGAEGRVHGVACAEDSTWIASDSGLSRWQAGQWSRIGASQGLPTQRFVGVFAAGNGAIWAATADTVYVAPHSSAQFVQVGTIVSTPVHPVSFAETSDATIWIGTSDALLHSGVADNATPELKTFRAGRVTALLADHENVLWVGGHGVERFVTREPGEPVQRKTRAEGLSGNEVRALFEDREGNVWVATSGGIDRFRRTPFVRVPLPPQLMGARSLVADGDTLWVGQLEQQRVLQFTDGRLSGDLSVPTPQIGHRDAQGRIWFAGPQGVSRLAESAFVTLPLPKEVQGGMIRALAGDRHGDLWISVEPQGLFRLSRGQWQRATPSVGLPEQAPTAIERDTAGDLWLGYASGDLFQLSRDGLRVFGKSEGLDGSGILALRSIGPRMWIGAESSLGVHDGQKFLVAPLSRCGPFRSIRDIEETDGGLWLYRPFGIAYGPEGVREMLAGNRVVCSSYSVDDGVYGEQHSHQGLKAMVRTGDGRLWLSTEAGLAWTRSERLNMVPPQPPATVENVETINPRDDIETAPGMRFPPGTRELDMTFTAWNLAIPDGVHFRHRLLGANESGDDEPWVWMGNDRSPFYANLRPGHYNLEVQASLVGTSDWGPISSMPFVILPYFHETWWFRTLAVATLLAVIAMLLRLQWKRHSRRLRERLDERLLERERISRELHDTLLQGVQGLVLQFQAVAAQIPRSERASGMMESILDRADAVISESRDRIAQLRESPPDTVELPEALAAAAIALCENRQIDVATRIAGEVRPLDGSVNAEVFLIAREAISNAVRHSGATSLEIELSYDRFWFRLRVKDDGCGIADEMLRNGRDRHFGLGNMRERANRLRGSLRVAAAHGGGTEVELRIPAALAYAADASRRLRE